VRLFEKVTVKYEIGEVTECEVTAVHDTKVDVNSRGIAPVTLNLSKGWR
jgi:hypothetical protein